MERTSKKRTQHGDVVDTRTLQAELGVVEPERRGVARRQQRAAALPDVERQRGGDQVGDAPLGARHHVQRPHAPLHGHGHQHLARRCRRPPAGLRPRNTSRSSCCVAAAARGGSPEAPVPDAGEHVRVRPWPLPQQLVPLLLLLLLGRAEAVERRRALRQRRQYPRVLPLPRHGILIHQRRKRRHRSLATGAALGSEFRCDDDRWVHEKKLRAYASRVRQATCCYRAEVCSLAELQGQMRMKVDWPELTYMYTYTETRVIIGLGSWR